MRKVVVDIYRPSMLLKHLVKFISPQGFSRRCALSICVWMSGFPLASFYFDHLLIVFIFELCIMQCAAFCYAASSLIWIAFITLLTVDYSASAPCIAITVSSSGSSGAQENSHIVWKHQWHSKLNSGVAVDWSLNTILTLVTVCQPQNYPSCSDGTNHTYQTPLTIWGLAIAG